MISFSQAKLFLIFPCLILGAETVSEQMTASSESNDAPKRIVCYFLSWTWSTARPYEYNPKDIPLDLCTDIMYAFMELNEESWELEDVEASYTPDILLQFASLRNVSSSPPNLLLAVHGWTDFSSKWSIMVSDPSKRSIFVASALRWMNDYGFNGLDLGWEYPEVEDKENFVKLVEELVDAFKPFNLILTSNVPMRERELLGFDIQRLFELFDWINVKSFDMRGFWNDYVDVHSPLYSRLFDVEKGNDHRNVHDGLRLLVNMGVPKHKLMVGIPFHGRSYTLLNDSATYLTAPANKSADGGKPGPITRRKGLLAYYEICEGIKLGNWTRQFDEIGKCPYAFHGDQWVGYDDEQSINIKMDFIKDKGYGGAMVWALNRDDFNGFCGPKHSLLQTIYRGLISRDTINSKISTTKSSITYERSGSNSSHSSLKGWLVDVGLLLAMVVYTVVLFS